MTKEEAQAIFGSNYRPGMESMKRVPDLMPPKGTPVQLTEEQKRAIMAQTLEEREATMYEQMRIQNKLPRAADSDAAGK